jgi:hypothetical protein
VESVATVTATDVVAAAPARSRAAGLRDGLLTGRGSAILLAVAAIVVAIVTRIPSERQPLHDDDWLYLDRIGTRGVLGVFPGSDILLMRPAVVFWFSALKVFGLHPTAWHVLAAGLLGLTAFCVRQLLLRLGLSPLQAIVGAAFFLFHPAWDIPVAWSCAVSSILGDLFVVCFLLVILGTSRWRLWKSAALIALALLSKETAALVPFIAAALMYALRRPVRQIVRDCAPLLLVPAVYGGLIRPHFVQTKTPDVYQLGVSFHIFRNLLDFLPGLTWLPLRWGWADKELAGVLLCLLVAAVAFRPGMKRVFERRLAVAGVVSAAMGAAPVLFLIHQTMFNYYSDMALIGGSVVIASLTPKQVSPRPALVAAGATAAVAVTTAVYTAPNSDIPRTRQMLAGVLPITHQGGYTVIHFLQDRDFYISGAGGFYRVESGQANLKLAIAGVGVQEFGCVHGWYVCASHLPA